MNVDFAAVGGTAYTVAGSMIIACMKEDYFCFRRLQVANSLSQMALPELGLLCSKNFEMLFSQVSLRKQSARLRGMFLSTCYD